MCFYNAYGLEKYNGNSIFNNEHFISWGDCTVVSIDVCSKLTRKKQQIIVVSTVFNGINDYVSGMPLKQLYAWFFQHCI